MTPLYAEWRPIKPKASTPCIHADRLSDRACSINAQADALIRKFSEIYSIRQEGKPRSLSKMSIAAQEGVSGFLCLGRLFQGQPNEAGLCI